MTQIQMLAPEHPLRSPNGGLSATEPKISAGRGSMTTRDSLGSHKLLQRHVGKQTGSFQWPGLLTYSAGKPCPGSYRRKDGQKGGLACVLALQQCFAATTSCSRHWGRRCSALGCQ